MHKHIWRERRVVRSYLINCFHRVVYDSVAAQAEKRTFKYVNVLDKECNLRSRNILCKFSPHSHVQSDCNENQPCNEGRMDIVLRLSDDQACF